jgi:hypothetical protein
LDIYIYDYYSDSVLPGLSFNDLAKNMYQRLLDAKVFDYDSVIFLAHSMGGIIVRKLLLDNPSLADKINFLYLAGTPTNGSSLANVVKSSWNTQFRDLDWEDKLLVEIQQQWKRERFLFPTFCAFEKVPLYGTKVVVDYSSATMLCEGPDDAILEDHIALVKPTGAGDDIHIAFKNAFRRQLDAFALQLKERAESLRARRTIAKNWSTAFGCSGRPSRWYPMTKARRGAQLLQRSPIPSTYYIRNPVFRNTPYILKSRAKCSRAHC